MFIVFNPALADSESKDYDAAVKYSDISFQKAVVGNKDSALYYGNKALALIASNDTANHLRAKTVLRLGIAYSVVRNSDSAIYYTEKCIEYAGLAQDTFLLGYAHRNQGINYRMPGKEKEAIEYYFKALHLFESIENEKFEALVNIDLGNQFYDLYGYTEAEEYFSKAISIIESCNCLKESLASAYNGLGNAQTDLKKNARPSFNRAIELYLEHNDSSGYAIVLNNIGNLYFENNQVDSAKAFYYQSLSALEKLSVYYPIGGIYINLGAIHNQQGNSDSALYYLKHGIDLSIKEGYPTFHKNGISELKDYYYRIGDYKTAYALQDSAHKLSINLLGEEKLLAAELERIRFSTDKLETENKKLKQEKEISEFVIDQVKTRNQYFAVALIVVIGLLSVILLNRRKIRVANKRLNSSQLELKESHKELRDLNTFQDKVLSVVGHDLRGYIGNNQSLIDMLENATEIDLKLIEMLKTNNASAQDILFNLVNWSKKVNHKTLSLTQISLKESIEEALEQSEVYFHAKRQVIHTEIVCNKPVLASEQALNVVLRNLLSNASKYTARGNAIYIKCSEIAENKAQIKIENIGAPFPEEIKEAVLTGTNSITKQGTNNEKGLGIGLQIVTFMLENMNSKLEIQDLKNGPSVSFKLDLA